MKRIYFVRHGATGGNEKNHFQYTDIPLSDIGLKQAQFVAERFRKIPIDILISSDMDRASQTAAAISKVLNMDASHNPLFREILRPTAVRGKSKTDPEVRAIMDEIKKNYDNKEWHHSDEENFYDLATRCRKALEYLRSLKEENILVVTHGHVLVSMIGIMSLGDSFSANDYTRYIKFFIPKNTGITIVEEENGKYFLLTWNDHSHLGDVDIKYFE